MSTVNISNDTVRRIRRLPGMQMQSEGVIHMTPRGQSVLETVMLLPKKKAEKVIGWLEKELKKSA